MPNPIRYTYIKDQSYADERELRIAPSAIGMGHFVLDGTKMEFPTRLELGFEAMADGTITEIFRVPSAISFSSARSSPSSASRRWIVTE